MPIKSQAQRRAMYAAAAGKSTLGIPKSVGADFVAAGPAAGRLPERVKAHNSPTAPGSMGKPSFWNSGRVDCATSPIPTRELSGTKQSFGPLEYTRRDGDQEYYEPAVRSQGSISDPARPWPYNKRSK